MLLPVVLIFSMIMVSTLIGFSQSLLGIHIYENELAARFLADHNATSCMRILAREIVKNPYGIEPNSPIAWHRILPADGNGFCLYSDIVFAENEFGQEGGGDNDNSDDRMASFELISNMSRSLEIDDIGYVNVGVGYGESAEAVFNMPANSLSRKYKISIKFKDGKIDAILMRI